MKPRTMPRSTGVERNIGCRTKKDIHLNLLRAGFLKYIIKLSQSLSSGHSALALMGKEPETFGSVYKYRCFDATGVKEIQYFPGRTSFRQPQTGCS